MPRQSRVICQLSANMATPTTSTAMPLETVLDRVEVNARWAPITSLLSRETSAPVWVRVKKASDWRWTCPNTWVRRSKISPSPIREESQPPSTARIAVRTETPAIASASMVTIWRSPARMPSSTMRCTSSGITTTIAASMTVRARKTEMSPRWGRAKPSTRRIVLRSIRLSTTLRSERMWRQAAPAGCMEDISGLLSGS